MKTKVLALALAILAFFFFVCSPFEQAANAIVGVDDAVIAILIAALAACGITFIVTESYGSLKEYVGAQFEEYATYRGVSPSTLIRGVESGTNKTGQLLLNNRFVQLIDGFVVWVKNQLSLSDNAVQTIQSQGDWLGTFEISELPAYCSTSSGIDSKVGELFTIRGTTKGYFVKCQYDILIISTSPIIVEQTQVFLTGQTVTASDSWTYQLDQQERNTAWGSLKYHPSSLYYTIIGGYEPFNYSNATWQPALKTYTSSNAQALINELNSAETIRHHTGLSVKTGTITSPYDDPAYTPGDGAILDVGAAWGSTYGDVIGDIEGDFADGQEGEATITYEAEEEVTEQIDETATSTVSAEASSYSVPGLQNVFPFCIPFDIYSFFECLAAEPVAPSFEWRFYVPGICDETIELDLSEFDTVAQIVRTMELLAFIVGLAFVTRDKMIKG